jgi:large subunit ribosomal protein L25
MEMGDTMRLADVPAIEGVRFLDDPDETVLATVTVPTKEVEPEPTEEELAELAEGEELPEGEEAPEGEEGEAAAEGEGGEAGASGDDEQASEG